MENETQRQYLNVQEAAEFLCLKKRTLDNMRWTGRGPSFRKHGGRIFYVLRELEDWSLSTRSNSTSEY